MARRARETVTPADCYHFRWKHRLHLIPHIWVDKLGVKQAALDWSTHRLGRRGARCHMCRKPTAVGVTDCRNKPCHKACAEALYLAQNA